MPLKINDSFKKSEKLESARFRNSIGPSVIAEIAKFMKRRLPMVFDKSESVLSSLEKIPVFEYKKTSICIVEAGKKWR